MAGARVLLKRAMFVRRGDRTRLAVYTRWRAEAKVYAQLDLIKPVRALFPPSALGVGVERSERGLRPDQIVSRLEGQGFAVLGEIDVACDEPLRRI